MENDLLTSAAAGSLKWLSELDIPASDVEARLQRALGCWAAETLTGVGAGRPGDDAVGRLLDLPPFDGAGYTGDPLLAFAMNAALHRQGLRQDSLAEFARSYARALQPADPELTPGLDLARTLLSSAGLAIRTPESPPAIEVPFPPALIDVRDELLSLCRTASVSSVWGRRAVEISEIAHILPPLAASYAMDWDLEAVCTVLRTCAYLGLVEQPGCRWAREWLVEQYSDGHFGLIHREIRLAGRTSGDGVFFAPTIRALWCLAELHHPGFLLGPHTDPPPQMRVRPLSRSRVEGRRPAPGMPAPLIRLTDLFSGDEIGLSDYRGREVLLVFVDPDCDPCDEVIAQLVELDRLGTPQIILVSRGKPADTRRKLVGHDIRFPVVMQDRWSVSRQYGAFTFPAAFLIDEQGLATPGTAHGPAVPGLLAGFQVAGVAHG
jgi:peroxiredoxin